MTTLRRPAASASAMAPDADARLPGPGDRLDHTAPISGPPSLECGLLPRIEIDRVPPTQRRGADRTSPTSRRVPRARGHRQLPRPRH